MKGSQARRHTVSGFVGKGLGDTYVGPDGNFNDDNTGRMSWTDKGTDPDMGGNAPGDVPNRFYIIAAE